MGKNSIYPSVRTQMVVLHGANLNQVQIPRQLKISRCRVQDVIKKYKQLGRFDDLKHIGRPKSFLLVRFVI